MWLSNGETHVEQSAFSHPAPSTASLLEVDVIEKLFQESGAGLCRVVEVRVGDFQKFGPKNLHTDADWVSWRTG
jgi:hypothetical protein